MPKTTKPFDKAAYDTEYQRQHYKKLTAPFKKEDAARVEAAAGQAGLSVSKYIQTAVFEKMDRDKRK